MLTSDDRLLTANESINIDTHIAKEFNKVIEEVEVNQYYNEHGKFMGKAMRINLQFKYE